MNMFTSIFSNYLLNLYRFLDRINNLTLFLSLSLILRICEAIGFAATFVSMYSFVPSQFPSHIPIVYVRRLINLQISKLGISKFVAHF